MKKQDIFNQANNEINFIINNNGTECLEISITAGPIQVYSGNTIETRKLILE